MSIYLCKVLQGEDGWAGIFLRYREDDNDFEKKVYSDVTL